MILVILTEADDVSTMLVHVFRECAVNHAHCEDPALTVNHDRAAFAPKFPFEKFERFQRPTREHQHAS